MPTPDVAEPGPAALLMVELVVRHEIRTLVAANSTVEWEALRDEYIATKEPPPDEFTACCAKIAVGGWVREELRKLGRDVPEPDEFSDEHRGGGQKSLRWRRISAWGFRVQNAKRASEV